MASSRARDNRGSGLSAGNRCRPQTKKRSQRAPLLRHLCYALHVWSRPCRAGLLPVPKNMPVYRIQITLGSLSFRAAGFCFQEICRPTETAIIMSPPGSHQPVPSRRQSNSAWLFRICPPIPCWLPTQYDHRIPGPTGFPVLNLSERRPYSRPPAG